MADPSTPRPSIGEFAASGLILAMAETDVQGVSTRKVTAIVEELCSLEGTSTQASREAAELDEKLDETGSQMTHL
jgi:transposase-like protein